MRRAVAEVMHAWTLMAVGPWIGLGVGYGLSVWSLVRQRRGAGPGQPKLQIVVRERTLAVDASELATLGNG